MTDLNRPDSSNLDAFAETTGTRVAAARTITGTDIRTLGCTLLSGTTYYFPLGAQHAAVPAEAPLVGAQVWWSAATTITSITVETTVFPSTPQAQDARADGTIVTDYLPTTGTGVGFWLQQNAPTAYVPVTGGTVANMTVSPTALTAGACEFDLGNLGPRRVRIKVVVGATGGVVRVGCWGKAAA